MHQRFVEIDPDHQRLSVLRSGFERGRRTFNFGAPGWAGNFPDFPSRRHFLSGHGHNQPTIWPHRVRATMKLPIPRYAIFAMAAFTFLSLATPSTRAADTEPPIDPVRGRALVQKASRGEALTTEEQAYLDRVKQAIRERAAGKQPGPVPQAAAARPSAPAGMADWSGLVPLTDLATPYKGEDGGLYGGRKPFDKVDELNMAPGLG